MFPVLHSVAEANASDESDGVAKQEDEQIGIFQILDKLEEAVDALLNTSSSLSLPQLEVFFLTVYLSKQDNDVYTKQKYRIKSSQA